MLDLHNILDEQGKEGVKVFIKAIQPYAATGKTQKSAYYKIEGKERITNLSIIARGFVQVLETGSKPAKTKKPSRKMIKEMEEYVQARGMPIEAAWPVAVVLLRDGQQVNRNVYSEQMNAWADEVADAVTKEYAGYAVEKMVNVFR